MAIDNVRWGTKVAQRIQAWVSGNITNNAWITNAQLEDLWINITDEHKIELRGHADIDLLDADIHVMPGTFQTLNTSDPVIGQGENIAVVLNMKIK